MIDLKLNQPTVLITGANVGINHYKNEKGAAETMGRVQMAVLQPAHRR